MNDKLHSGPAGRLQMAIVPVTPFQQNCTLIFDSVSKRGAVIDPGGDIPAIEAAIAKTGMKVESIHLTHGHLDHAGGAEALKARLGVPIVGPHVDDEPLLERIEQGAEMFGVPGMFRNCRPDRYLADGEIVEFGGHRFEVIHCPGHAPGHVVYFNRAARFAHVGDVLFSGSVGRTDLPGGNHAALIDSIQRKLLPLGDDISFVCGHGPGSTFGRERVANPYLRE